MLRVLIDNGNAPPLTGIGVYSAGLYRGLCDFSADTVAAEQSTAPVVRSSLRPLWRLVYLWNLRRLSAKGFGGTNVVHFTNVYVPPPHPKVAFVATIHDIDAMLDPSGYSRRYRAYFQSAVTDALRRAQLVVSVSQHARKTLLDRFSVEENKVRNLGMGLSEEFVQIAATTAGDKASPEPVFLFVGSLSVKKNIPWLIRTFVKGVKSGALPKARLVLAGTPGYGHQAVSEELNRSARLVSWRKSPSTAELIRLYRDASAVMLPSRTEGFGIPLIEAMYLNKPIVASDIPTSREVAGGAACFFQLDSEESFYQAVHEAYADHDRERRTAAARAQAERYRWQNIIPGYVAAYTEAIDRRR